MAASDWLYQARAAAVMALGVGLSSGRVGGRCRRLCEGRRRRAAQPQSRLFVDDPGQFWLARQQLVKIDDVERQERAAGRGDDAGVARRPGQQCQFAKELTGPEIESLIDQLDLDLA